MNIHPILVFIAAPLALVACLLWQLRRASTGSPATWDDLLRQLRRVHVDGIDCLANSYLCPGTNQTNIEPAMIYELLGGSTGLKDMRHNADIIYRLASYSARWNFEESTIVAERIRLDVQRLKTRIRRVQIELYLSCAASSAPFRLMEAASAYYLMRRRLLALYETSHAGLYPILAEAV